MALARLARAALADLEGPAAPRERELRAARGVSVPGHPEPGRAPGPRPRRRIGQSRRPASLVELIKCTVESLYLELLILHLPLGNDWAPALVTSAPRVPRGDDTQQASDGLAARYVSRRPDRLAVASALPEP